MVITGARCLRSLLGSFPQILRYLSVPATDYSGPSYPLVISEHSKKNLTGNANNQPEMADWAIRLDKELLIQSGWMVEIIERNLSYDLCDRELSTGKAFFSLWDSNVTPGCLDRFPFENRCNR